MTRRNSFWRVLISLYIMNSFEHNTCLENTQKTFKKICCISRSLPIFWHAWKCLKDVKSKRLANLVWSDKTIMWSSSENVKLYYILRNIYKESIGNVKKFNFSFSINLRILGLFEYDASIFENVCSSACNTHLWALYIAN